MRLRSRSGHTPRGPGRFGFSPTSGALAAAAPTGAPPPPTGPDRPPTQRSEAAAWGYYGENGVPELHYSSNYKANCLGRCRVVPGIIGDDDEPGPLFDEDAKPVCDPKLADLAVQLARMLRHPVGGQGLLLAMAELNMTVTADFWLLGSDTLAADGTVTDRTFEVCSKQEIVPMDRGWGRRRVPGAQPTAIPPTAWLRRIHRPHPQWSLFADSPIAPLLSTLERMRLLGLAGQGEALSRLAGAGVLWVAEEIDFEDDDDASNTDPLQRRIISAFTIPINDPAAPGVYSPYVIRVPGEVIEKNQIRFDRFDRPDFDIDGKRDNAMAVFARGIDLPVEVVSGVGAANHWSAWAIDEDTYKAHVEPDADLLAALFTANYFRPELIRSYVANGGSAASDELARVVLMVDAARLVLHPNREKAADVGYGSGAAPTFLISGTYWRQSHNIPESARPDDDEVAERLAVAEALKIRRTDPPPGEPGPTPQVPNPEGSTSSPALPEGVTAAMVAAAVEVAAERAADRIAGRARDRARKLGHGDRIRGLPARAVCSHLTAAGVPFTVEPDDLPPGEFTALGRYLLALGARAGVADPHAVATGAVADAERLAWTLATRP